MHAAPCMMLPHCGPQSILHVGLATLPQLDCIQEHNERIFGLWLAVESSSCLPSPQNGADVGSPSHPSIDVVDAETLFLLTSQYSLTALVVQSLLDSLPNMGTLTHMNPECASIHDRWVLLASSLRTSTCYTHEEQHEHAVAVGSPGETENLVGSGQPCSGARVHSNVNDKAKEREYHSTAPWLR